MSGQNNIGNLLRGVIGRLQQLEDSESPPSTSRAEVPTRTSSMPSAHNWQYQDTESCLDQLAVPAHLIEDFYSYNPFTERNHVYFIQAGIAKIISPKIKG